MIIECAACKPNAYQDAVYGKNKRVHNPCKEGGRCTVCLNVKKLSAETKKAEEAKSKS